MVVVLALQAGGGLGEHHVRAEHPGLLTRPAGELVPADAMREARIVPDHGAAARLAAGNTLLQHHCPEALGCGIDPRGQAGWPRPDDDEITGVDVVTGISADRLDDLGGRRLDHRVAVVADHDGQARRVQALVIKQAAARRGVSGVEVERHVETGEQFPQLMRTGVLELPDDVEQVEAGFLVLGPVGQELTDFTVQILLEHPWLAEVVVSLAQRHGPDDRAARRVVALHQEHPLGQRVQGMRGPEEIDPGHLAHVVVGDEQRHRLVPGSQLAQRRQARGRG